MRSFLLFLVTVLPLAATENGLPVAHTGGFGQPTCAQSGCHRLDPLPTTNTATVRVEVGPYVPGASQEVRVILESAFATRWGFQLTARQRNDTTKTAGSFTSNNNFVAVRCPSGSFAPCASGDAQYVTQTSAGTNAGGPAKRQVWGFTWTPPASDVGPVDFAVAALASNNDKGTNGDLTVTAMTASLYAPSNAPMLRTSGGALNAAALSVPGQAIAPKQLLSIFGTNLNAPGAFIQASVADLDFDFLLPTSLGKLSFEFKTPNDPNVRLGRMIFVGENQANLQVPDFPPDAADTIQIQAVINRNGGQSEVRSNTINVNVARYSPGLFTFGNNTNGFAPGQGPAAAVNGVTAQLIAPANLGIDKAVLARPGDVVLLYGTGFGPTTAQPGEAAELEVIRNISISIGGVDAQVLYAGTAPTFVGLQQFNVVVPNLAPGNHEIVVRQNALLTQPTVFLPVGP